MRLIKTARKLFANGKSPRLRRALARGVAGATEHLGLLGSVSFRTLIDIGANKGQFTLAALEVNPDASVIAFEPLFDVAQIYEELFTGMPNVRLVRKAIGAKAGPAQIHRSRRADSSSLLEIGDAQTTIFPGTEEVARSEIEVATLGECFDITSAARPILVKIDVQGYELEVLKGSEDILDRLDHFYAELSFVELYVGQPLARDVIAWLAERGFGIAGVYNLVCDASGRAIQADFHFTARSHPR